MNRYPCLLAAALLSVAACHSQAQSPDAHASPTPQPAAMMVGTEVRPEMDTTLLRPHTTEHTISAAGRPIGRAVATLSREANRWRVITGITFGRVEQKIEALWSDGWEPVSYSESYSGGATGAVAVRAIDGYVQGTGRLPGSPGEAKAYNVKVPEGGAWDQMKDMMLETADLAEGRSFAIPVFNSSTGEFSAVLHRVGGRESVTVPAGTIEAYRVDVTGGSTPQTLWLRARAPHTVVKIEVVGHPLVIELASER